MHKPFKVHSNQIIPSIQKIIAMASKISSDVKNFSQKHIAVMVQLFPSSVLLHYI